MARNHSGKCIAGRMLVDAHGFGVRVSIEPREKEIRDYTRVQIFGYLQDAAEGKSELLMKEVWEQCEPGTECEIAQDEVRRMIAAIKALP